jgi:hypothetical protein
MKTYRRIEITAFRRRRTVTSGGSSPDGSGAQQAPPVEEGVWLNDADTGEAIEVASDEGQIILTDAVRSLERRLSAGARSAMCVAADNPAPRLSPPNSLSLKLRSLGHFIYTKALRLVWKEK